MTSSYYSTIKMRFLGPMLILILGGKKIPISDTSDIYILTNFYSKRQHTDQIK